MKLNNNLEMPAVGIGTYCLSPDEAYNSVREALRLGCRLIDTANAYCNEKSVGRAMRDSGVKREDIFLSTKIWASEYRNDNAVDETLARLGVDYIDLLFLHQPCAHYMHAYKNLEKAYHAGKIRAIGISNFEGEYIDTVLKNGEIVPQVMQVEAHPYFTQGELRKTLAKHDIKLMSWYPLGHGDASLMNEPVFKKLGEKYGKTSAQICLRWHVDMGFIVIPGSKNPQHVADNFDILDFALTQEEMAEIAKLDAGKRYYHRTDEQLVQFAAWRPDFEN
ncbi:MAG: aldo/keto reductase [Treponemataceae bacterium]|nr:aldo/keto reductase [Treponemataceae bacterium]